MKDKAAAEKLAAIREQNKKEEFNRQWEIDKERLALEKELTLVEEQNKCREAELVAQREHAQLLEAAVGKRKEEAKKRAQHRAAMMNFKPKHRGQLTYKINYVRAELDSNALWLTHLDLTYHGLCLYLASCCADLLSLCGVLYQGWDATASKDYVNL
jgi:hypothetical protein